MKKKMIIGTVILVILIILVGIIVWVKRSNDKNVLDINRYVKYNENQEFLKEQELYGMMFGDISCSYNNELSVLTYTITNNTDEVIYLKEQKMLIKDKDGNIIETIVGYYDYEFQPGEAYSTGNTSDKDLSEAYTLELVTNN